MFIEKVIVGIKKLAGFSIVIFGDPLTPIRLKTISLPLQTSKQFVKFLKSKLMAKSHRFTYISWFIK